MKRIISIFCLIVMLSTSAVAFASGGYDDYWYYGYKGNSGSSYSSSSYAIGEGYVYGLSGGHHLNLRSNPSTEAYILQKLDNRDYLIVYGMYNDWYEVEYYGIHGYVHSKYIEYLPYANSNATYSMRVYGLPNGRHLNLRSQPSTSSTILSKLSNGDSVSVYQYTNGWYEVDYYGTHGYVSADYLR